MALANGERDLCLARDIPQNFATITYSSPIIIRATSTPCRML